MERSVAQVSRYLDQRGAQSCSENAGRLLMCAFYRSLRRHAARLRRIQFTDCSNEILAPAVARECTSKEDCKLDAERAASQLSTRAQGMYQLRRAGHDWNEIAQTFGITPTAARAEFSREIKRVKLELRKKGQPQSSPSKCNGKAGAREP
jgi:DNA-directed RNA polymerase specialized sigma24 family protein